MTEQLTKAGSAIPFPHPSLWLYGSSAHLNWLLLALFPPGGCWGSAAVTPTAESHSASSPPDLLPTLKSYSRPAPAARTALFCKLTLYQFSLHERQALPNQIFFFPYIFRVSPLLHAWDCLQFCGFYFTKGEEKRCSSWNQCFSDTGFYPAVKVSNKSLGPTSWHIQCRSTKHKAAAGFLSCFPRFLER